MSNTVWVQFMDMHSGGDCKLNWEYIYIEATDVIDAREYFEKRFGRHPDNVTCETCGEDYSISVADKLGDFCSDYISASDRVLVVPMGER